MTLPSPIHNKSHTLLVLAAYSYLPDPADAEAQAQLRQGFEAIIDELHRVRAIPDEDIDQFVAKAKAGASHEELLLTAVLFANFLPDEDYYAALAGAGFTEEDPPLDPLFWDAAYALYELHEKYGEAMLERPEYEAAFQRMLKHAPPDIKQYAADKQHAAGLLPKASHVDEQGRPIYTLEQVANAAGISAEILQQAAEERPHELNEIVAIDGFYTGPAFPVQ